MDRWYGEGIKRGDKHIGATVPLSFTCLMGLIIQPTTEPASQTVRQSLLRHYPVSSSITLRTKIQEFISKHHLLYAECKQRKVFRIGQSFNTHSVDAGRDGSGR